MAVGATPRSGAVASPYVPPGVGHSLPADLRGGDAAQSEEGLENKPQAASSPKREKKRRKDRSRRARSPRCGEAREPGSGSAGVDPRRSREASPQSVKVEEAEPVEANRDRRDLRQPSVAPEVRESRPRSPTSAREGSQSGAETEEVDKRPALRRRSPLHHREVGPAGGEYPTEPPPGRWVLCPPGQRRPPEPAGPPPSWRGPVPAGRQKSRGVVRRLRNADIAAYGFNQDRKRLREERYGLEGDQQRLDCIDLQQQSRVEHEVEA